MPSYYSLLEQAERYYFSIRIATCPVLDNATIHFNRKGFRHFIRKKNKFRKIQDQIRRLKLLYGVIDVIQSEKTIAKYNRGDKYHFWSLENKTKDGITIKVLISKSETGKHNFFSVM